MSELKSFDIVVSEEGYLEGIVKYRRAVYDKSEADKVIAEKDAEIAELKDKVREQTSIAEEGWKECGTYHTSYAEAVKELYDKNKEIAELKADYKEACDRLQTANLIKDEQKAKADKLLSCLRCLVKRDLIKDCHSKKVATEIVKEYDNGLG